ncbi:TIGR00341 family protein [Paraprevotella clara]|jgi:TIGR00341 family protein|uniref:TIGR00341 family protein n=1 Tax=Paraprevotella clara TaxID=454154 RepID=UPI0018AAAC8D|nr:TIGR00341 family protein [Paraprevotella clara]MBS6984013.1 TIGR00341 family protein [Paraprevotella clara]
MENKTKKERGYLNLFIRRLLSLRNDKVPEEETIASIKASVEFRGANLWILIFAIFVASLGLNTNSAAVIIGAMLISPLMGPIMGMGLGVGINDFELLKRAFRSFATATIFSVLTATFYFAITPIDEAQSELLARTSPTIYDVLIALFGGLAGIVALCSTGQRGGNVIPGVAIATAIMPPLCTTGFGIATGNWIYAAGAFYLYLINSIFISLATFIGVNIFDFKKKVFVDKQREKRVKHIIVTIAVLTMLPSTLLTYMLVRENFFTSKANNFVAQVVTSEQTQVIAKEVDYHTKEIRLVTIGEEIPEKELTRMKSQMENFGLEDAKLSIVQGTKNLSASELKTMLNDPASRQADKNAQLLANEQQRADKLQKELDVYKKTELQAQSISAEMATLFPEAARVSIARTFSYAVSDSLQKDSLTLVSLTLKKKLNTETREKMEEWLKTRLKTPDMKLIVGTKIENNDK